MMPVRVNGPRTRHHLDDYLTRIGAIALLTAQEEIALAKRMEAGTRAARLIAEGAAAPGLAATAADGLAARRHMIEANLRLVVSIARRYAHRGMSLADVIQDGNLGLIEAVERFDHRRGTRFSTLATWWIRKTIQRGLEHAHTVRLPIGVQDQLVAISRAQAQAAQRLGRAPAAQELAEAAGLEPDKLAALRQVPWTCVSLDLDTGDSGQQGTIGDLVEDDRTPTAEQVVERKALQTVLTTLVDRLAPRQALIMRLRFGLDGHDRHTPRQVADQLGLTPQWVRALEKESLARMRAMGRPYELRAWAS